VSDEPSTPRRETGPEDRGPHGRKPYTAPRLIAYGSVARLTQTGGISVKDLGSMKQANT
jgi:hypothetical protein